MTIVVAFAIVVTSVSVEKPLRDSRCLDRNNHVIVAGATSQLRDNRNVQ